MKLYYDILRVSPNTSQPMIKDAYVSLKSRIVDPELLIKIDEAYSILGDPESRANYDDKINIILKRESQKREELRGQEEIRRQAELQRQEEICRQAELRRQEEIRSQQASRTLSYKSLLSQYVGQNVGINMDAPTKLQLYQLIDAQNDHFSIEVANFIAHIPYSQILRVLTSKNNEVLRSGFLFGIRANIFIEIFHMVVYKGGAGFGMAVPMDC